MSVKLQRVPVNWPTTHVLAEGQIRHQRHLVSCRNRCNLLPRQTLPVTHSVPMWFSIWRHLRQQDAASIVDSLEALFCKQCPANEMLADNNTAFRSRAFRDFPNKSGIWLHFCSAHDPSGKGITEWYHQCVKWIVVRELSSGMEAVYWNYVTPKDDVSLLTGPANIIHSYQVWLKSIDTLPLWPASHYGFMCFRKYEW